MLSRYKHVIARSCFDLDIIVDLLNLIRHCIVITLGLTFAHGWTRLVVDVSPTLYKCYTNALCLLGCTRRVSSMVCLHVTYPSVAQSPLSGR